MSATISDIINLIESIAPSFLAEEWDNVGLQVGQKDWPVRSIQVALDPLLDVVAAACSDGVDLLITHHPLIFHSLKSIDSSTPVGSIISMAIRHRMAIFAAHTNLDKVVDGVNDVLAHRIGLKNLKVLTKDRESEAYKLVVYAPVEYELKILDALFEAGAGKIGAYTCCSFRNDGKGTFRPGPSAKPFVGELDDISHIDEVRIETVVQKNDLKRIIEDVKKSHPYETMAYDVYQLLPYGNVPNEKTQGLGRIGELENSIGLASFASEIKKSLGIKTIKVAGKPDMLVKKVAVCAGSGSSLMDNFFSSKAQVYISGDLRYHDARAAEAARVGLIDIGHFASEHLIVEILAQRLKTLLVKAGIDIEVKACGLETDPFFIL